MNVGFVNLDSALADGDSVSVQFLLGIHAGASRADQRHRIGFRLVNFDEFLQ